MATAFATPHDLAPRDLALDRALDLAREELAPWDVPVAPERPLATVTPIRQTVSDATFLRRRVMAVLMVLAAVAVVVGGLQSMTPSVPMIATQGGQIVIAENIQLQPGDTLWDLAVAATPPGQDPRVMLEAIRGLNGFTSDVVPVWTTVAIPGSNS